MQDKIGLTRCRRAVLAGAVVLVASVGMVGGASARDTPTPEARAAASEPGSASGSKGVRCSAGKVPVRRGGRVRCARRNQIPFSGVTLVIEHEDGMGLVATRKFCYRPYLAANGYHLVQCVNDVHTHNASLMYQQMEVFWWNGRTWVFWYVYRI